LPGDCLSGHIGRRRNIVRAEQDNIPSFLVDVSVSVQMDRSSLFRVCGFTVVVEGGKNEADTVRVVPLLLSLKPWRITFLLFYSPSLVMISLKRMQTHANVRSPPKKQKQ
jgi:hypothetical protein